MKVGVFSKKGNIPMRKKARKKSPKRWRFIRGEWKRGCHRHTLIFISEQHPTHKKLSS